MVFSIEFGSSKDAHPEHKIMAPRTPHVHDLNSGKHQFSSVCRKGAQTAGCALICAEYVGGTKDIDSREWKTSEGLSQELLAVLYVHTNEAFAGTRVEWYRVLN